MNRTVSADSEKRSCAVTLSDMEMFIFPELIYSLVLANVMSPRIWRWRDDPWFDGLDRMTPYRRISRIKQYIMDHYAFNLDLETWGVTTVEQEMDRFKDVVTPEELSRSNALFGYEGDKYYFDIDIRTHFGLDKYTDNIIPYWKTETVEAMDAFVHKPEYTTGAGECVSLATLYAAALFIVGGIPLSDIYLMATPLHSQNFVDVDDGILTNNRRLVTKRMWFNGTELSAQARRALENERVTIVAHESGFVHTMYGDATISPDVFQYFSSRLTDYLKTGVTPELLGNFLRHNHTIQSCFQMRWKVHGIDHYIPAERVFAYEHGSPYRMTDNTRAKLLDDIDQAEFSSFRLPSRVVLNDLEEFVKGREVDIDNQEDVSALKKEFASDCLNAEIAIESLISFCCTVPQFPDASTKRFISGSAPLGLQVGMSRDEVCQQLLAARDENEMARMAFYAYRDLSQTEPEPFLRAAMERNPVAAAETESQGIDELVAMLSEFPDGSIYDGSGRLAQPDEVWNYRRGDGVEKALLLANIIRSRDPQAGLRMELTDGRAVLHAGSEYVFSTSKDLGPATWDLG